MIKLELSKIRLDGGTQPRKSILEEAVKNYTEVLLDGVKMPPVTVFFDGKDYWLADGFHRYHAHKAAGFKEIECDPKTGTKRDAFIFSLGANATHGMPRTNEEKRDTVIMALNDVHPSSSDRFHTKTQQQQHTQGQTLDFFGEISGFDFTTGSRDMYIGIAGMPHIDMTNDRR